MCESQAILVKNGVEETLLNDVVLLEQTSEGIKLVNIRGETKVLKDVKLAKIDFLKHRIYFMPR